MTKIKTIYDTTNLSYLELSESILRNGADYGLTEKTIGKILVDVYYALEVKAQ